MIDSRSGETKKPAKSQDSYLNDAPKMPNRSNVQPSQKKGGKASYCEGTQS